MVAALTSPTTNVGTAVGTDVLGQQVKASEPEEISIVPTEVLGVVLVQPAAVPPAAVLPRTGVSAGDSALFAGGLVFLGLSLRKLMTRRLRRTA